MLTGMSWDTIKEIDKSDLRKHYKRPKVKGVRRIGIDEFSVKKGHTYMTVIVDLDTRRVLRVVEGRKAEDLIPVLQGIKKAGVKIEAVSMDMSPAYIKAVSTCFPAAQIIFDKFHLIQLLNQHLNNHRAQLYRQTRDIEGRSVIKGTRWLLMYGRDKLKAKGKAQKLQAALDLNAPLAAGYYLKEELRELWSMSTKEEATVFLEGWLTRARTSGYHYIEKMANSVARYQSGILAWFDHPISNAVVEGMNNKIKVLKRNAYGYRDLEYFKLKVKALFQPRYALS